MSGIDEQPTGETLFRKGCRCDSLIKSYYVKRGRGEGIVGSIRWNMRFEEARSSIYDGRITRKSIGSYKIYCSSCDQEVNNNIKDTLFKLLLLDAFY